MGRHVVTIDLVGGHGCDRTAKEGDALKPCNDPRCVDCQAADFVQKLAEQGHDVTDATHAHWPDDPGPVDDLKTRTRRSGSF